MIAAEMLALLLAFQETAQPSVRLELSVQRDEVAALEDMIVHVTLTNQGPGVADVAPLELEERALRLQFTVEGALGGVDTVTFAWSRRVPDPVTARLAPPPSVPLPEGRSLSTILRVPAVLWGTVRVRAEHGLGENPLRSEEVAVRVTAPEGARGVQAVFDTSMGEIVVELDPARAPRVVTHFASLARQGFYDGSTLHAVVPEKWAQGGDPFGVGSGGPGYAVLCDQPQGGSEFRRGVLGMAAYVDERYCGSQFFICFSPIPTFNRRFLAIGAATPESGSTLDAISAAEVDDQFQPRPPITVRSVTLRIATGGN